MREFHLCMDIRNALLSSTDKELGTMLIEKGGRKLSARQTKEFLLDQLAMGRKFMDNPKKGPWKQVWRAGQKFWFFIYNGRNPSDSFNAINNAPVRVDER